MNVKMGTSQLKSKIVIVVFILTLSIIAGGFCFAEEFHPAKVRNISDREYEQAVINLIDNAKKSVVIGILRARHGLAPYSRRQYCFAVNRDSPQRYSP